MRSKIFTVRNTDVRESRWALVQHDDLSLHVEQEATYRDGQNRKRSVPINDFLRESGPPPRFLQPLIDQMFEGSGSTTTEENSYQEFVECDAPEGEGVIFIKVVTLLYQGAVEFDTEQAKAFAHRILDAIDVVESKLKEWQSVACSTPEQKS